MSADPLSLDTLDIVSPAHYAAHGYPHREWAYLRQHAPVFWYDRPITNPFWAITKHADIVHVSRQPRLFLNAPRMAVFTNEYQFQEEQPFARHLLNMDPPDHARFRSLVSRQFTPRGAARLTAQIESITRSILDSLVAGTECDFVNDVSAKLPLAVIADLLGVPQPDWPLLFRWTNETVGSGDPQFQRAGTSTQDTIQQARMELFQYFSDLVDQRRADPKEDIVSVLATAQLDGQSLPVFELLSYFFLLVVAGNETTRNATTGGMLALLENPGEWEKLKRDRSLIPSAVEEIVRWTSPVIQFCRTAATDTEVRGQRIKAGQSLCLFYPSAGRDEEVFEDPFRFRVDRNPNPHISFGIGEHFCLGANLARLELEVFFRQMLERVEHIELTGPVRRLHSSFVGGITHAPIRYRLTEARP